MTIEENVNKLLRINKMTKQQLADKMLITYQTLWRFITGNPTIATLEQIAKALNCKVVQLLDADNEQYTSVCPHCKKPIKINVNLE